MLSAVERTRENPPVLPTARSRSALTPSGIAPRTGSPSRNAICTGAGAMRLGDASTVASTVSKSASSSPGKCFSPTGPGSAPMSFGRCIIASPAAATGAGAAATGVAATGLGAAAGAGLAATAAPLVAASAPSAAGAGAPPPSFRKRDGASSGKVVSGCNSRARASSTPSLSRLAGSGIQQSTGHTAAHASWSWKPTHSVHFDGTM